MTCPPSEPARSSSGWFDPATSLFARALRGDYSLVRALVRLRWLSLVAQVLTVALVALFWHVQFPVGVLSVAWGVGAVSNALLMQQRTDLGETRLAAVLLLDVALLTVVLAWTGGPANPFSVLYQLLVMLAAIVGPAWLTWLVVVASSVGFGALFFLHEPLPPLLAGHMGHGGAYSAHLQGMWLAHVLCAGAIALFVSALARALQREREKGERTARLLGLTTLAAGAAHEIGNPLGTIRIAASEFERELRQQGWQDADLGDLQLIEQEVGRARRVLDGLATSAGELMGESPVATELSEVVQVAIAQLGEPGLAISLQIEEPSRQVFWPVQAVAQALLQLLRNAVQAGPAQQPVELATRLGRGGVYLEVVDHGSGLDAGALERVGEPFFTTRPGSGMGLGVFIARSLFEHLGGTLQFDSRVSRGAGGGGTVARVWLPLGVGRE